MIDFLDDQIDFDDEMVNYYDEMPLWSSPFGILLLNNIPFIKNAKIVDVGCGTGFPLLELSQRYGKTCKLFGIDPWKLALDRAKAKKRQYRIRNVEIVQGIGETMPFTEEYIDIVISNLGINNFKNPDEVIAECFRVLRSKGKLIFTTNLYNHFSQFYSVWIEVLNDLKFYDEIKKLDEHMKKRYTLDGIEKLVNRNRFTVENIVEASYVMRFVDGNAFLNHYFIKLAFLQDWKEVIKKENWNIVFSNLENRLNDIADKNGELALKVPMAYIECEK